MEVIDPESETQEQKIITARLYATINGLTNPLNRLSSYITMAKTSIPINADGFGLTDLREDISANNAAGVIDDLQVVTGNVKKYKDVLMPLGLSQELITRFDSDLASISNDKQLQYEIKLGRTNASKGKIALFNGLNETLCEILNVGKVLYPHDTQKMKEYTFSELKKKVRRTIKPKKEDAPPTPQKGI